MEKFIYSAIIKEIQSTNKGQERNMYPWIRDLFIHILGYSPKDITVDISGEMEGGIPDLIIKVPSGIKINGKDELIDWIIVEAKDENGIFLNSVNRESIFKEKSKYISLNTAFFIMIDPECMVVRNVIYGKQLDLSKDTIILWNETTEADFRSKTTNIAKSNASILPLLKAFREGDVSLIASIKLNSDKQIQAEFFNTLRKCTRTLQYACMNALNSHLPEINVIKNTMKEFKSKYDDYQISFYPFRLEGKNINTGNNNAVQQHKKDVSDIKKRLYKNFSIAKLALEGLPLFQQRTATGDNKLILLFSIETANLIFARILMLRFFEDHGFFGEKKYVCNGGVEAFQKMMLYFDVGYTKLLKEAYQQASHFYSAIFDETELDWVFGSNDKELSDAIEIVMFYLSRFDFTTIKGDILTGIYDRFLEGSQRKSLGEYYTPPSIARYIVDRLNIKPGDKVLDPACGSGTFLIEAYQKMAGEDAERGLSSYDDVLNVFSGIAGNDINAFSAVISQMQLLWHIMIFKEDILNEGFPDIMISDNANSLIVPSLNTNLTLFQELDRKEYDFVIGNPPYVRPERLNQEFDRNTIYFYEEEISSKLNLYGLFIYKALRGWCKTDEDKFGKLGFIVPLSFCDSDEMSKLRRLFAVNKNWRILEIVDMELIAPYIFDAAVNPIIIIAENKPATKDDTVIIRVADEKCLIFHDDEKTHVTFDLFKAVEEEFKYQDIFTEDGRILTKITNKRLNLIKKIGSFKRFEDIAATIWVQKEGNSIVNWKEYDSLEIDENGKWEKKVLISMGAAFRNKKIYRSDGKGFDIYKGENIKACTIEGNSQETKIDVDKMDDPSLWKFRNVLPKKGFAFLRITLAPTAVSFNPDKLVFLNTATLFFPDDSLVDFPLDILVLSSIYRWYFGLVLRCGIVEDLWSDIYPSNLRLFPWTDKLKYHSSEIENLREPFLESCRILYDRDNYIMSGLKNIKNLPLKEMARKIKGIKIKWSEYFKRDSDSVVIARSSPLNSEEGTRLFIGDNIFIWIEINNKNIAKLLSDVLNALAGIEITKEEILNLPIPDGDEAYEQFKSLLFEANKKDNLKFIIDGIDSIVAAAFDLNNDELSFIKSEVENDSFLKRLKLNLPFTGKRKRGLLAGLDSSDRYE